MMKRTNKYVVVAIGLVFLYHGSLLFFTLDKTYDALIHLFFGGHYAQDWFSHWNQKWYTGFTVMGYPPLVHQLIGFFSFIGGLKFGLFSTAYLVILIFITGVYRYALLLTDHKDIAGLSAVIAVFSSSFIETLHLFGQLPSLMGIGLLMHTLPDIYRWLRQHRIRYLIKAMALLAVTVCSHHVTPIFGMVFFIFPIIGMAIMDDAREGLDGFGDVRIRHFWTSFWKLFWRNIKLGISSLFIIVFCILPYWINTKNNPITQVPIPHGSRDNFLEVTSSGLVFFLLPWGLLLVLIPYFFYRLYNKRYIFFGLSFTLLVVLGTGGTTPIPLMLLGENAFNILTLDRFTLWATIMILPFVGEFIYRYTNGDLRQYMQGKWGPMYHRITGVALLIGFIFFASLSSTLSYFRPSQPAKIELLPIQNFLSQDEHYKWRFLTLGFGDQMALLSATTEAQSVDGNYHSARSLPELTTRAVERLENAKFRGIEGLGSLEQFLSVPEKYHLRYIFSNDKFYDPMLFFHGWHKLTKLSNGIQVWERSGVDPLPAIQHIPNLPNWQKLMWGFIPLSTIVISFLIFILFRRKTPEDEKLSIDRRLPGSLYLWAQHIWAYMIFALFIFILLKTLHNQQTQHSPTQVVSSYYDALDFKRFNEAFDMILPTEDLSKDQYLLQIASQDGLLNSYAKMESIKPRVVHQSDSMALVSTDIEWVTALSSISKTIEHTVIKKDGKWYLESEIPDADIVPDQVLTRAYPSWYNQGKREVSTAPTKKRDILMQPVVVVTETNLVQKNGQYHMIGQILNVDDTPADISIECLLYNKDKILLAKYRDGMVSKHKLLPKESTLFRIDFDELAWQTGNDAIDENVITRTPSSFEIKVTSNVNTYDLERELAIVNTRQQKEEIELTVLSQGIYEITIAQLLTGYYDYKKLIWVEDDYGLESIKPIKTGIIRHPFLTEEIEVINTTDNSIYINSYPNETFLNKYNPDLNLINQSHPSIYIEGRSYLFQLNNFIGNR